MFLCNKYNDISNFEQIIIITRLLSYFLLLSFLSYFIMVNIMHHIAERHMKVHIAAARSTQTAVIPLHHHGYVKS